MQAAKGKLGAESSGAERLWVKFMGKLNHLRKETARINHLIEEECDRIEEGMWHPAVNTTRGGRRETAATTQLSTRNNPA